jgi:hypothetical protein
MATLRQSNNTDVDYGYDNIYSTFWRAQTFTTGVAYTISSVKLLIFRVGSPGTLTIGIRAVDGDGRPTGSDLTSGTYDCDAITTTETGEWIEISLTNYALSASTTYAIVARATSGNGSNTVNWLEGNPGGYTDGKQCTSSNSGSTWSDAAGTYDYGFETYSPGVTSIDQKVNKQLVAASLTEMWYGTTAEVMTQLAASVGDIDGEAYPLNIFELLGKVFVVNGPNLKVMDFTNVKIATTDVGSHPPDFNTVLTGGTSGAKMVVDYITALSSACTIYGKRTTAATFSSGETVTGTDDDGNAISFTTSAAETAPPHWYDWTVYGNSATYGVMPNYAGAGCNYRGRANITADQEYPHQWYQSRQYNPWDWNYAANDAQSPVRGGDADAGEVGGTMIVSIPYKDDFCIDACADSLWYLSGDAAEGGSINELDLTTGMLGDRAFCWDKDENLYMITTRGITRIPSGFGRPEFLTEQNYPDFIKDLAYDPALHRLVMGYHRTKNIIKICKTTLADGDNSCWVYDLVTEGLFPESYPEECGPFSMFWYEAVDPDYKTLLHGCYDGFIRYEDDASIDDNIGATTEAVSSYVTWVVKLSEENKEGVLHSLVGVMTGDDGSGSSADSDDVTCRVFTDRTADGVIKKLTNNTSPRISVTISAPGRPRGDIKKRKVRGVYAGIRLQNTTAGETWGIEKLLVNGSGRGRIK